MRPARGACDFRIKTSVSGPKQKDFAILWFSKWAAFTGHCSCRFHVGFSVVVVLYSYIVEYAFVQSVERRQVKQEIRRGWKFCKTCFQSYAVLFIFVYFMSAWHDRVVDLTLFEALTGLPGGDGRFWNWLVHNIREMFDCRIRSIYDFVSGSSQKASKL